MAASYTGGPFFDTSTNTNSGTQMTMVNMANTGGQKANVILPYGANTTTGLTGDMSSTQIGGPTTFTGLYLVCVSMFPTATGSASAIQATVTTNDGGVYTANVGTSLSNSATTNLGGGCLPVVANNGVTISVATTGYSGSGTYTVHSSVVELQ